MRVAANYYEMIKNKEGIDIELIEKGRILGTIQGLGLELNFKATWPIITIGGVVREPDLMSFATTSKVRFETLQAFDLALETALELKKEREALFEKATEVYNLLSVVLDICEDGYFELLDMFSVPIHLSELEKASYWIAKENYCGFKLLHRQYGQGGLE